MGQKVNPIGFRTGVKGCLGWKSRWFSKKNYADFCLEDIKIRQYLNKNYSHARINSIDIERSGDHLKVIIKSAVPGLLIGKKGKDIEDLRVSLASFLKRDSVEVSVSEIKNIFLHSKVVAQAICEQLERRISFKRAIKKAASDIVKSGARGVKICVAGRLDGAEIAREEWVRSGSVPLHTFRADIDYGFHEAKTLYGIIGVKVWICRGQYKSA